LPEPYSCRIVWQVKQKRARVRIRDEERAAKNFAALSKVSFKIRRRQLQQPKEAPLKRESESPAKTKVTLKLNASGNLRGMHNALNPPESDYMKKIRAMRRFYNKQMPVLQCSGCAFGSSCPQFKAGYECAFLPFFNSHRIDTATDLVQAMKELCGVSMRRAHVMTLMETLSGGMPGSETTEALTLAFDQMHKLNQTVTQNGEMQATIESEDQGIIGRLFGGLGKLVDATRNAQNNPIDAMPVPVVESTSEALPLLEDKKDVNYDLMREHMKDELSMAPGRKRRGDNNVISVSENK
jgi:hypothetical protein